ncbi:hypothetical protein EV644_10484 [Kribbella orskensis]|uniref:SOS response associated peptidase (SRAP) n=1 Tax=Kribbella orskensis TaxID=2512216 RepID=A0ABY2BPX1_9ACTN|nr:hypothetical protein EV642_10384 [Kribbella sp. VKM Ac-2500]TCO25580.1 hypothetical protein EV644_10484 [Kribbella orskensis]
MCGRYASASCRANLLNQFDIDDDKADELNGGDRIRGGPLAGRAEVWAA